MAEQGVKEWVVDEPYLHLPLLLGEGPHHSPTAHTLRFLDINSSHLYTLDLNLGPSSLRKISTGVPVGVTADIAGSDPREVILCGAKDGVTRFWLPKEGGDGEGRHEYLAKYWDDLPAGQGNAEKGGKTRRHRANDGGVDTRGRFWVETFVDPEVDSQGVGEGVLWRFEGEKGGVKKIMDNMTIPNGISWTEGDGWMYLTDSPAQRVYRFPYDKESGEVDVTEREKRVWFQLEEEGVFPDGHALDVQGNVWQACYGGGKVIRISPEGDGGKGRVTGVVRLPTRNVTCPVFVGKELFVTTAKDGSEEGSGGAEGERSRRYGGSLFRVDVGVEGVAKREVRLDCMRRM